MSVVLFPILEDYEQWKSGPVESRTRSIAAFKKLNIPYHDLFPTIKDMLAAGIDPCQAPGDSWHPNKAACVAIAEQLHREGLLDRGAPSGPGGNSDRDLHRAAE